MTNWLDAVRYDPIPSLLDSLNPALEFWAKRDLLGENPGPVEALWELPEVGRLLNKQRGDGSWKYPSPKPDIRSPEDYDQLETYRNLGVLVEMYGFNQAHPAISQAAEFLFRFQTDEGDFRGIYGTQYTPNYSAGIMELLIKAGYGDDPRIHKGFDWLLEIRQFNDGWTIPVQTVGVGLNRESLSADLVEPDRSKPSSQLVTGIVLRAFAAHETYRHHQVAWTAGEYLATRFFKRGEYPGRQTKDFWTKFSFPFWFNDLLSSLDALSLIGFSRETGLIQEALDWLLARQCEDGQWELKLLRGGNDPQLILWVGLAICRGVKRFYE